MSDHFYTTSPDERDRAIRNSEYRFEMIACNVAPTEAMPQSIPLYRLFKYLSRFSGDPTGDHFYTTSVTERDNATTLGYRYEFIACYVFDNPVPGTVPLYRLFNTEGTGDHFYTTSAEERDRAVRQAGYRFEFIACHVFPGPMPATVPFFRLFKRDKGLLDSIGSFLSDIVDAVVGAVTTIVNTIVDAIETIAGPLLNAIGAAIELLFSIPIIGRLLREAWDIITTAMYGVTSIIDFVGSLLGLLPEKRLKICVVIQRDETKEPIVSSSVVLECVQFAITVFKSQANIRILPVGLFHNTTAFNDVPEADPDYIAIEDGPSDTLTLDVSCGAGAWFGDLGEAGSQFETKMVRDCFPGSFRRIIGYGAPIVPFAVRHLGTNEAGCSLGPLADYVTVIFSLDNQRALAHELGHACNLWHDDGNDNLMKPDGVNASLGRFQVALLRASRHITFF
jgi:hypothetical protein